MKSRIARIPKQQPGRLVWMSRRDVKDYLRVSWDTVDRRLVPMADGYHEGKMRYETMKGGLERVRILADDVYQILPLPESMAAYFFCLITEGFNPNKRNEHTS